MLGPQYGHTLLAGNTNWDMENMDVWKTIEENSPSKVCSDRSFICGFCDFVTVYKKEWEQHQRNIHEVSCVTENEAELYQAPEHGETRIIGQMNTELQRFGIDIGIFEIIELDIETLE